MSQANVSITLNELNSSDRHTFVQAVGFVFEHSPWVAERAWARKPFHTIEELHRAMVDEVASAGVDEQLLLLRAHPDLGTHATMSSASAGEQTRAGFDSLIAADAGELSRLNTAYREKFGFPFLYAVKGSTKRDILRAIETRLGSAREHEFGEALRQAYRIARFRLDDLFS